MLESNLNDLNAWLPIAGLSVKGSGQVHRYSY